MLDNRKNDAVGFIYTNDKKIEAEDPNADEKKPNRKNKNNRDKDCNRSNRRSITKSYKTLKKME